MQMSLLAFPPAPAASDPFHGMDGPRSWCKSAGGIWGLAPADGPTLEIWNHQLGELELAGIDSSGEEGSVALGLISASLGGVTKDWETRGDVANRGQIYAEVQVTD
ncbi:hypothetical protein llap_10572 [Limosa lapponica baueri]|uniref:Uncharacterized protein n=1 Tax=Limosa lapponica baueri TaxID=1758121 RepID=A0A2I0TZB6_LIMLA|nr:hypothetical protein llap_10572 [Limosa lapponica baueri]